MAAFRCHLRPRPQPMSSRFTPQGTRPLALLLAAAALVAPARVAAQGADRAVATVRLQDGVMIIGAGRDGTVSISLGDPHEAHKARREQVRFHERFDPGEVDAWVDALESRMRVLDTLQVKDGQPREMTSTLTLGHPTGAALSATWYAPAVGSLSFDGRPCPSTGGQSVPLSRAAVATLLPALRMAASAARSAAPASRRLADQRVYESHEVSCPAFPESGNPRPRPPDAADGQGEPGAYELLATLVVGIDGRAESGSVRVMDGSDPRFVASFLAALPEWQFTPASRAGVLVRQRTHVVVPFGSPVVADTTVAPIRFGTTHDGRVVIGPMVREWRFGGAPEQRLHAFDVITPEMAESWADSAVAAMRMADTAIHRCEDRKS